MKQERKIKTIISILLLFGICLIGFAQSTSETKEIGYIIFAPDSAAFENEFEAKGWLDQYTKNINEVSSKEKQIHINGYTAIFGNDIDPTKLSEDRANIILNELLLRGISSERFDIIERSGGTSKWGNNETSANRRPNRRVTISIDEFKESGIDDEKDKSGVKINWKKVAIIVGVIVGVIVAVAVIVLLVIFVIGPALSSGAGAIPMCGGGGSGRVPRVKTPKMSNVKPSTLNTPYRKPVDGVGGRFIEKTKTWKLNMNNIPKSGNDPVKPMTQRDLIKLDNDLINGVEGKKIPLKNLNRLKREYGNILKKDNLDIPFKNKEPDFSKIAFEKIKIKGSPIRYTKDGVKGNMQIASEICSKKWGMPLKEFEDWRNRLQLVWHEGKTGEICLVPHNIHANIPHEGLIALIKI
jgi:hypothetical protein